MSRASRLRQGGVAGVPPATPKRQRNSRLCLVAVGMDFKMFAFSLSFWLKKKSAALRRHLFRRRQPLSDDRLTALRAYRAPHGGLVIRPAAAAMAPRAQG
ncbi:MAG: hypothetical protein K5787_11650 [Lentisphaeria bacterium]|nr:hypothetical protein [Lentisphaeria bacterium]